MQGIFIKKICSNCNTEKLFNMFPKKGNQCKSCQKKKRQAVKEKKRQYDLKYRAENKEKLSYQCKIYDQENKTEIRARKRKYIKQRRAIDVVFKLRSNISKSISQILQINNSSKNGSSCLKYLPYSIQELKDHIENQFEEWMTWENYGKYDSKIWDDNDKSTWTWQLDHIIPQSYLPYTSMENENFRKCWSLDNLRPLNSKQNLTDGARKK